MAVYKTISCYLADIDKHGGKSSTEIDVNPFFFLVALFQKMIKTRKERWNKEKRERKSMMMKKRRKKEGKEEKKKKKTKKKRRRGVAKRNKSSARKVKIEV